VTDDEQPVEGDPEQLGVRPVPALAQRFLTPCVRLDVRRDAAPPPSSRSGPVVADADRVRGRAYIFLFIGQIAIAWTIRRDPPDQRDGRARSSSSPRRSG
jgi:hypothetical protein